MVGDVTAEMSSAEEGDSRLTTHQSQSDTASGAAPENLGADLSQNSGADSTPSLFDGLSPDERINALSNLIRQELDDDKAEDIVEIELSGKSDIADKMIIASGRSQRHVSAIAEQVMRRLKEAGLRKVRCEGQPACDWVLIDAHDVIVHLFRPEVRSFYNLERIWSETAQGAKTAPQADGDADREVDGQAGGQAGE